MNQAQASNDAKRRRVVRRRRRERQTIVFGIAVIVLAALAFAAAAVYRGDAAGPFSAAFHTPEGEFETNVTLACPPAGATPLPYEEVVVRVANGTDVSGLAGEVADTLEGRNFEVVDAINWPRPYGDHAVIQYGKEGLHHAYTLATQFDQVELVLDSREGVTLDVILGTQFASSSGLRQLLSPDLDPNLPLTERSECLPVNLIIAQPAPRNLPENPLLESDPAASGEPEADAEAETDDEAGDEG